MPSHTAEERKKRRVRARTSRRGQTSTTNDIIAAEIARQPAQSVAPGEPVTTHPTINATRTAGAPESSLLPSIPPLSQIPGARRLSGINLPQKEPITRTAIPDFLQLTPENQAEVERLLASRTRGVKTTVAQAQADQQAQPTNPFDVAVNRTLNDPNAAPFNASPGVLRAAEEAAGGPIALGQRHAASRQRQRLQDLAASSETLEVRNGRLRPRRDIVAKAQKELPGPSPLSPDALAASQDAHKKLRAKQAERITRRREGITGVAGATIGDVLFQRSRERSAANIEAGGSIGRLRQQRGAAAERSRLIGVQEAEAFASQIAANKDDPKIIAAGLRSPDPQVAQSFAQRFLGGQSGGNVPQAEPGSQASNREASSQDATQNYQIEAGAQATQTGVSIASAVGVILADLNDLSPILRNVKDLPKVNRKIDQALEAVEAVTEGPERDAIIDSLIKTITLAVTQLRPSQFEPFRKLLNGLKGLRTKTTRSRDQGSS